MFFVCFLDFFGGRCRGDNYVTNLGFLKFLLILHRSLESYGEMIGHLHLSKGLYWIFYSTPAESVLQGRFILWVNAADTPPSNPFISSLCREQCRFVTSMTHWPGCSASTQGPGPFVKPSLVYYYFLNLLILILWPSENCKTVITL